jgi:peptidoglycan/xylan/chitin deacetylase (PgdA/CDA1 family)
VIKAIARQAFHASRALDAARWLKRRRLRILMYHRFADRAAIDAQCAHIRDHYSPISLTRAAEGLLNGNAWPDNALVVTVDDGYHDFYRNAYPAFREYGIPATVYLVSEFLDGRIWLWVDQVRWAYLNSQAALGSHEQRLKAALTAIETAKQMPNAQRLAWLEALPGELGVNIPGQPPAEYEPMTWDDVRAAANGGMDFGAHTCTHPILSRLAGEGDLTSEIGGSKRRIEDQLGRAVEHFCYPNGSPGDFTDAAVEVVRQSGFRTATTTTVGLVSPTADVLRLPRIGVQPELEERYFAECAAGIRA